MQPIEMSEAELVWLLLKLAGGVGLVLVLCWLAAKADLESEEDVKMFCWQCQVYTYWRMEKSGDGNEDRLECQECGSKR